MAFERTSGFHRTYIGTYSMHVFGFDWDEGNREKCRKHGVATADIEAVFANQPRIVPDVKHSDRESRFIAVGRDTSGRALFVAFTLRQDSRLVRPVSARYMHKKRAMLMPRKVPKLTTDEEAERFLNQDLSDLDFSQFKPVQFEFKAKDERVNMRLPTSLLQAVKATALAEGMPYQRFIRQTLERAVTGTKKAS